MPSIDASDAARETHRDRDRFVVVEQQWGQVVAGGEPVAAGDTGGRVDQVAERPQAIHVTTQGPVAHVESLGELGPGPEPMGLQEGQELEHPTGRIVHGRHAARIRPIPDRTCPQWFVGSPPVARGGHEQEETPMTAAAMITARGLTRWFDAPGRDGGRVDAVKGIDLDVAAGELVAFLGPNGAGKSTTLRMLTTLLQPSEGTARVAGCDVREDPAGVRSGIGYIGQGNGAGHAQRVRDELVTQGRCYGMSRSAARERSDELLGSLGLGGLEKRVVSTLSGGQRRRLDIALGMVHHPSLLFLDEPSTGLDPQNRANLQREIAELRDTHGTTIVLTTHYLDEADALADRVVVVDHGRVIADDTATALKSGLAGDLVVLVAAAPDDVTTLAESIERAGAASDLAIDATTVTARLRDGAALLPGLLVDLHARGVVVRSAEVARPTLDDVFLALTGRSLREGPDSTDADDSRTPVSDPDSDPATLQEV